MPCLPALAESATGFLVGLNVPDDKVPVTIHDSEGQEPIEIEMIWAWTPKRR